MRLTPIARQRRSRVDALHLLHQHHGLFVGQAAAAVLHGPGRRGPAFLRHAVAPKERVRVVDCDLRTAGRYQPGFARARRAVLGQPGPGLFAELIECGHLLSVLRDALWTEVYALKLARLSAAG